MQRQIIYDCLDQHQTHTGFRVPELLAWYLTDLLVERIRRVDIIPDQYQSLLLLKFPRLRAIPALDYIL
jgi:hypothetical protein